MTEQILICFDGSNEAARAIDAATAFLGPRHAAAVVTGSRGARNFREFTRGSVSQDGATHARRAVLIAPPVTT